MENNEKKKRKPYKKKTPDETLIDKKIKDSIAETVCLKNVPKELKKNTLEILKGMDKNLAAKIKELKIKNKEDKKNVKKEMRVKIKQIRVKLKLLKLKESYNREKLNSIRNNKSK